MSGYLVDTSVFVAAEQGRPLASPPEGQARVSVATLTELGVGVRRAKDEPLRQLREATLARAQRFVAVPYDERVADKLADLLSTARAHNRRAGAMDAIIASTALTHDLTVWTHDRDFEVLAELAPGLQVQHDAAPADSDDAFG
ncbi:MAG: PIN domain-containing protein [Actinomycetota bacterium]|nr:PIN domain-containing protein [Actinomycetota bacterium]